LIGEMINSQRDGGVPHQSVAVDGPVALVAAVADMEMDESGNGEGHSTGNRYLDAQTEAQIIIDDDETTVILPSGDPVRDSPAPKWNLPRRRSGLDP
jgi:hypothetical protein